MGGAALLLGLAAGDLLFQALRAVMLALFGAPYRVSLAFSPPAVGLTLVYFLFIYLFALLKGRRRIRRMKIRELIYLDRRNEEEVIEKSRSRRRIFVLSVILGAVGTLLLLMGGMLPSLLGTGCVIAFLYGFFLSFASGVPLFEGVRRKVRWADSAGLPHSHRQAGHHGDRHGHGLPAVHRHPDRGGERNDLQRHVSEPDGKGIRRLICTSARKTRLIWMPIRTRSAALFQ